VTRLFPETIVNDGSPLEMSGYDIRRRTRLMFKQEVSG